LLAVKAQLKNFGVPSDVLVRVTFINTSYRKAKSNKKYNFERRDMVNSEFY